MPANEYITYAILGMIFKTASWVFSFSFIAKGESKLYVVIEVVSNILSLSLGIIGYKLYGLRGMGISFTLSYIAYFVLVYAMANRKYSINLTKDFGIILFLQAICVL
jgi:O-antigen/teichoic acid export membrane protein